MKHITVGDLVIAQAVPYFPNSTGGLVAHAYLKEKEWILFDALWQCEGTLVTRRYLFAYIYQHMSKHQSERSVDVLASRVRKKIKHLFGYNCIHQIRNEGYLFRIQKDF